MMIVRVLLYVVVIFALSALAVAIYRLLLGAGAPHDKWVLYLVSFGLGFGATELARRHQR